MSREGEIALNQWAGVDDCNFRSEAGYLHTDGGCRFNPFLPTKQSPSTKGQ